MRGRERVEPIAEEDRRYAQFEPPVEDPTRPFYHLPTVSGGDTVQLNYEEDENEAIGVVADIVHQAGRWYWEVKRLAVETPYISRVGFDDENFNVQRLYGVHYAEVAGFNPDTPVEVGEVWGFALDLDEARWYVHRNGVWVGDSPDNGEGTSIPISTSVPVAFLPIIVPANGDKWQANFGNRPFAYSVPEGYNAGWYTRK
jgi:hypothetical protein